MSYKDKISTVSDLKYYLSERDSHFFDRDTLKFFHQTMRDFHLSKSTVKKGDCECFELRSVTHPDFQSYPMINYHYFDVNTLEEVYGE